MSRNSTIAIVTALFLWQTAALAGSETESGLKIHLLREAAIKDKTIRLGDVAVASGNEELLRKAEDITLGSVTLENQKVTIDRYTIKSRLGSSGIDISRVTLTGADKTIVVMARKSISLEELLAEAEKFAMRYPLPADQRLHPLDVPAEANIPDSPGKLEVIPSLIGKAGENPMKVKLTILCDGKEKAVREIRFIPVPRSSRTASVNTDNPKTAPSVKPSATEDLPKVVFRNQPVVIEIDVPGLKVTAMGLPLEDGRAGQIIKVRNIDSKRDIVAKVKADGTVSPVL